jgi:hypothetical protein
MFNVRIGYLPEEEEISVVKATTSPQDLQFNRLMSADEILSSSVGAQVPARTQSRAMRSGWLAPAARLQPKHQTSKAMVTWVVRCAHHNS